MVHMCSTSIMACWICGTRATNHLRKCHGQTKVYSAICLRRLRARPNPYLQDQFGRRPTCLWPFQASACHTSTWCNLPISYCLLQVSHGSNSLTKRNLSIKHVTGSDVGTKWKGRAILMKYLMANMNQLWIVNVMWGWTTATTSRFQRRAIFTGRMSWPDALIVFLNLTHHTNYQPEMILKPYWVSFSHPPTDKSLHSKHIQGTTPRLWHPWVPVAGPALPLAGQQKIPIPWEPGGAKPWWMSPAEAQHHETNFLSFPTPLQLLFWHIHSEGDNKVSNQAQCSSLTTRGSQNLRIHLSCPLWLACAWRNAALLLYPLSCMASSAASAASWKCPALSNTRAWCGRLCDA